MRRVAVLALLLVGCSSSSSSSSSSGATGGDGGSGSCPDLSGNWKVTQHCDMSLVGSSVMVTETGCNLSFAAPFNGFTGSVDANDKVTLSGPQTCTGTGTATGITMTCTPGTCVVTLSR